MTSLRCQHKRRLPKAIEGIHVRTRSDKRSQRGRVPSFETLSHSGFMVVCAIA